MKKRGIVYILGGFVILAFFINTFVFVEYKVEGVSMQPTYEDGKVLSINKLETYFKTIERFDVVVFHPPNSEDTYVKRVIGLPGDEIKYRDDQLYVNGRLVEEPFLPSTENMEFMKQIGNFSLKDIIDEREIPKNHIFVIGDNRIQSRDSRHFGLVNIEDVIGTVGE